MTLSNLEKQDTSGQILPADRQNYAHTVGLRKTTFGKVERGRGVFLGVSHAPIPRGRVQRRAHFCDTDADTICLR